MQALTAAPREHLTEDQVRALLTGDVLTIDAGLELLDTQNRFVEDISDVLVSGTVTWDNRAAVHGSCRLSIQRRLAWGRDRLRPFMTLSNGGVSARFNLGVYIPTTPDEDRGENPITYTVTGYNVLSLLQNGPADTYVVTAGTTYYDAIVDALTAADVGIPYLLPGTLAELVVPATRVWVPISPVPSWLRIITDLLFEAGYTAPWADENGNLTARPFQDPATRPVDWALDTTNPRTNLVADDRKITVEAGDIANWWRFVRTSMATTPVEGNGLYTTENVYEGASSQIALDRVVRKLVPLEAADQAALVAQGDKIVAADKGAARTVTLRVDPLPLMGFDDVFQFTDRVGDGVEVEKLLAASWDLNLDGSPSTVQLGGAPRAPLAKVETQMQATVTGTAPLRVVVDGATVTSFANALNGQAYSVGERVTVTARNPLPPLIQGVES